MSTLLDKANAIKTDKDTNLLPGNLKQGVTCLGVTGTYSGGIDTSDATATANKILEGYTAYAKGAKITGTLPASGVDLNDYFNMTLTDNNKNILKQIPQLDTSELTDFSGLFAYYSISQLPTGFDFSTAATISNFASHSKLTSLPSTINTAVCNGFDYAFCNSKLTGDLSSTSIDVSYCTEFANMFEECHLITKAPSMIATNPSEKLSMNISLHAMFRYCSSLTTIGTIFPANYLQSLTDSHIDVSRMVECCFDLNHQSILNVLNLIPYTDSNLEYKKATLFGLYWRLLKTLSANEISTYLTANGWTTGLEDLDTYRFDGNIYNSNGDVIANNLSDIVHRIYDCGWIYTETTSEAFSYGDSITYNSKQSVWFAGENTPCIINHSLVSWSDISQDYLCSTYWPDLAIGTYNVDDNIETWLLRLDELNETDISTGRFRMKAEQCLVDISFSNAVLEQLQTDIEDASFGNIIIYFDGYDANHDLVFNNIPYVDTIQHYIHDNIEDNGYVILSAWPSGSSADVTSFDVSLITRTVNMEVMNSYTGSVIFNSAKDFAYAQYVPITLDTIVPPANE